jgi:hypothetical protein
MIVRTECIERTQPCGWPLADIGIIASGNLPVLVPEIVLLYKAHERTEKDEAGFRAALPDLSPPSKSCLELPPACA